MSPIIRNTKKHIGWIQVTEQDPEDYDLAASYCLDCKPGGKMQVLYSNDFKGDKFVCDNCGKEIEFDRI